MSLACPMTTRSKDSDVCTNAIGTYPASGAPAGAEGDETIDIPTPCPSAIFIALYSIREGTYLVFLPSDTIVGGQFHNLTAEGRASCDRRNPESLTAFNCVGTSALNNDSCG